MLVLLLPVAAALVGGCAYLVVSMVPPATRVGRWLALWLVAWAEIVLTAELLSLLDAVTPFGFLVCYVGFGAIAAVVWIRRGRPRMRLLTWPSRRQVVDGLRAHPALGVLLAALAVCALVNLIIAVTVPVTNADSLTYHLARVGYWIQHGSTDHFFTNNVRHNTHPPNSEFGILSAIIFARAEWPAPLGQYAAYFVCLAGIYFVGRRLGASNAASLFAALLVGTMSEIILQATIPKNDLMVSSFLICSIGFLLCSLDGRAGMERSPSAIVWSALGVGLAVGTKFTTLFFLPGLAIAGVLLTVTSSSRDRIRRGALWASCCVVSIVVLGSLNYWRNVETYGSPTSAKVQGQRLARTRPSMRLATSNIARDGYYLCDFSGLVPHRLAIRLTALRARVAPAVYRALRIPLNAPDLNAKPGAFPVDKETGHFDARVHLHEDRAWFGPIAFFVGLPLVLAHLVSSPWRRRWAPFAIALMAVVYWVGQSSVLRYNPWRGRFFVTAVVTAGPLLAYTYLRGRTRFVKHATTWLLVLIGLSTALVATIANPLKPLYPDLRAFRIRDVGAFKPETGALVSTLDRHVDAGTRIGLLTGPSEAEWPLFGRGLRHKLIHVDLDAACAAEAVASNEVDMAVIRRSVPLEKVAPILGERPVIFALRSGHDMAERDWITAHWWCFVVADSEPTGIFFPARDWVPSDELWFGCDQVFVPTRVLPAGAVSLHIEAGELVQDGVLVFDVYAGDRLVETVTVYDVPRAERAISWPGAGDPAGSLLRIVVSSPDEALDGKIQRMADVYRLLELPEHVPATPDQPEDPTMTQPTE